MDHLVVKRSLIDLKFLFSKDTFPNFNNYLQIFILMI